jgi:hypothetical protein
METIILTEGVLNDDTLHIASEGKVFKGNYIAIIEYYTFQNAWSNKKHIKRFRNQESLNKYLSINYPEFILCY